MAKKIISGIGSIFPLGAFGLAKGLIGKKKKKAAPAVEAPAPVMPMADDEAVKRARKRSIAAQMGRRGRDSTILTDSSDRLGG